MTQDNRNLKQNIALQNYKNLSASFYFQSCLFNPSSSQPRISQFPKTAIKKLFFSLQGSNVFKRILQEPRKICKKINQNTGTANVNKVLLKKKMSRKKVALPAYLTKSSLATHLMGLYTYGWEMCRLTLCLVSFD